MELFCGLLCVISRGGIALAFPPFAAAPEIQSVVRAALEGRGRRGSTTAMLFLYIQMSMYSVSISPTLSSPSPPVIA